MTTVLVIIDMQVDFCALGSLAVPDAEAILRVINRLMREFGRVILAQDWHPPGPIRKVLTHLGEPLAPPPFSHAH
jgi:nicotinamidase/pyrazinamidase